MKATSSSIQTAIFVSHPEALYILHHFRRDYLFTGLVLRSFPHFLFHYLTMAPSSHSVTKALSQSTGTISLTNGHGDVHPDAEGMPASGLNGANETNEANGESQRVRFEDNFVAPEDEADDDEEHNNAQLAQPAQVGIGTAGSSKKKKKKKKPKSKRGLVGASAAERRSITLISDRVERSLWLRRILCRSSAYTSGARGRARPV